MKKLYKKGTVHPTPPPISDHLSFLPATIFTLTAALSLQDREVLAYLLSCSSNNYPANNKKINKKKNTTNDNRSSTVCGGSGSGGGGGGGDHPPSFNCCCFRCYKSYWVRWDASPNQQLIHEIIDAFEEGLTSMKVNNKEKNKKARRNQSRHRNGSGEFKKSELSLNKDEFSEADSVEEEEEEEEKSSSAAVDGGGGEDGEGDEEGVEKGSVRRLVSFLGEKIWSVWN